MKLTIKKRDTVHYIKGNYNDNQLKEIKCYLLDKLQEGNIVKVNLDELNDQEDKVVYMIQRLKRVLVNRRQLQYSRIAA